MDPIKDAIDATEPRPAGRVSVDVTISSTGRQVRLETPPDLTHTELLELLGWMTTSFRKATDDVRAAQVAGEARPPVRLELARALPG